jgi:hypothetical protein
MTPLPALGALGGILLGCANRESDRADDAERARERAIGERDEARRVAAELRRDLRKAESDAADADGHALTLSTEVDRLRKIEADALADDDCNTFEREGALLVRDERDELRKRCDDLTTRAQTLASDLLQMEAAKDRAVADSSDRWQRTRAALAAASADAAQARVAEQEAVKREATLGAQLAECRSDLATEVSRHAAASQRVREANDRADAETARADAAEQWRATLDGLAGREVAEVARDANAHCSYCAKPTGGDYYTDPFGTVRVCRECADGPPMSWAEVRTRVATRAASCPARRHSPDPLAIACKGCGAPDGYGCTDRHPD